MITSAARQWSVPLAIGEFCWHLSASNELSFIRFYSGRWDDFADDERTIRGSCYGYRLFRQDESGASQWTVAQNLLRLDPFSRRVVLLMSHPLAASDIGAVDIACASSLQFLLRDGRLDAILHMRSNDAFWGLPYDVFLFTMLQELLASELRVELGVYYHSVGSLHLYAKHLRKAREVLDDTTWLDFEMPPLSHPEELGRFLAAERALRLGASDAMGVVGELPEYWRQLAEILACYSLAKRSNDDTSSLRIVSRDSLYRDLLGALDRKPSIYK
jgi:thymidylate synthase